MITPPTPAPSGPSQEDIKKVISDYKAREAKKGTGDKDKETKVDDSREPPPEPLVKSSTSTPKPASPSPVSIPVSAAGHRKFALHRQIFEMRQNEIKRKEMGVKAREVGKGESGFIPDTYLISRLVQRRM